MISRDHYKFSRTINVIDVLDVSIDREDLLFMWLYIAHINMISTWIFASFLGSFEYIISGQIIQVFEFESTGFGAAQVESVNAPPHSPALIKHPSSDKRHPCHSKRGPGEEAS